ncbi:MAG: hypothetical protein JWN98_860 [Abditibacteriota bacterium]|nr:hypothetical protein [Abditibacteriota bacterium]
MESHSALVKYFGKAKHSTLTNLKKLRPSLATLLHAATPRGFRPHHAETNAETHRAWNLQDRLNSNVSDFRSTLAQPIIKYGEFKENDNNSFYANYLHRNYYCVKCLVQSVLSRATQKAYIPCCFSPSLHKAQPYNRFDEKKIRFKNQIFAFGC